MKNYRMVSRFGRSNVLIFAILPSLLGSQPGPENLNLTVIEGEGGINNIRQPTTQTPTVRVDDEKQHPVAGAVVVFALPTDGPSGTFQNGARTLTVTTNAQGLASARGFKPNTVSGEMLIHVNASFEGHTG